MPSRAQDWFRQAERDLQQARASHEKEWYEWACFAAQQAAEKAIKALHLTHGQEAWGHMAAKLLQELPVEVDPSLIDRAQVLDNFYIPARYPDSHPEGAPFEHFGPLQSENALDHADTIIEFVRSEMADADGGA